VHIPDGFLSNRIAVALDVVSCATILHAARRARVDLSGRAVPVMGVLAAFVFAAQMFNFPILGGTSGHLIGGTLLAILLGPVAGFLTMSTVVIAQALFLQDGGLVALGANIFNIGAVTCFSGYALFNLLGGGTARGKRLLFTGFLAGWVSVITSSACCAVEMGVSGAIPLHIGLTAMLGYHVIIGVIEGLLTAGVLSFLLKVRPDLMKVGDFNRFGLADWVGAAIFVALPCAILILAGTSKLPDPLQKFLAASPLLSGSAEALPSSSRYPGYLMRIAVFAVLLILGFAAAFLGRHHHAQPGNIKKNRFFPQ
jgi:cobalt/nickel transport system permease protein